MSRPSARARYNGATAAAPVPARANAPPAPRSPEIAIPMRKKPSPVKDLLLSRYAPIADGIAALFFPYAEVVIHDLHDQTVLYLANNLSKREVGDDSALEEIDHSARERVIGPYEKLNWDGRRMRCVSNVLFGDEGRPAGMMCINFNIAVFDDVRATLDVFIKGAGIVAQPDELFRDDWQERINTFLHGWLRERQVGLNGLTREHRRELVEALYAEGAFRGKSAANYVANVLGMGRATVYKHLKHLKETQGDA
ncbi:TPA: PAS domain-containing protein [Burkholderia vietnamiensis]|nr:PAS domain-containing protein [Burkholderia vietnamiensis]HDR9099002.1 PAS domain-containing protein [Burkholderia vietnamiensis]HDR9119162.1 PAS domain-containing protein [Burkholderia vietnamiensis]HDR9169914.1 PAS domain-containing protein [Burkholderia vietnamiensis]HDR9282921.1 PAS domain-containing protein [Burkholderia vietnamiensis]